LSKEQRHIQVGLVVNDYENLPLKHGEQMYADDVVEEVTAIVNVAVTTWYQIRGHSLLACEPIL